MSDALVQTSVALDAHQTPEVLAEIPNPVIPAEANDNERQSHRRHPEGRMFELPRNIWIAMVGSYAVFLTALLLATGGNRAAFAIAICGVYIVMFFGAARVMLNQSPPQPQSPIKWQSGQLRTAFGPLGRSEVYVQVLIVPVTAAIFAIGIGIISAVVG